MTPETILAVVLVAALAIYVATGGADFGGGVWEFFVRGPRAEAQRHALKNAIAPIWEANHVWLILVVVLLFVCYPTAFSILMTALHIPLTLMLIGIVLRGAAFAFRSYSAGDEALEQRSIRVFATASVVTPVMLGVTAGAVASGDIEVVEGVVQTNFLSEWIGWFPLSVGLLLLAVCAWLAAVYMTYETRDDEELCADFRRRAHICAPVVFVTGGVAALAAIVSDAHIEGWFAGPHAAGVMGIAAVAFVANQVALRRERYGIARFAAACVAMLIVTGWGLAQYPWIVPGEVAFSDAAPHDVLVPVLWTLGIGSILLLPAFAYLYRMFGK